MFTANPTKRMEKRMKRPMNRKKCDSPAGVGASGVVVVVDNHVVVVLVVVVVVVVVGGGVVLLTTTAHNNLLISMVSSLKLNKRQIKRCYYCRLPLKTSVFLPVFDKTLLYIFCYKMYFHIEHYPIM